MKMSDYSFENPSPRFLELAAVYREVHEVGLADQVAAKKVFFGVSLR